MHILDQSGRELDDSIRRAATNVSNAEPIEQVSLTHPSTSVQEGPRK